MTSITEVAKGIGNATVKKLKKVGIDSVEKLASSKVEDLLNIDGIGVSDAKMYIQFAQKHIERLKAREKIYTIIKKGVASNTAPSQNTVSVQKPIDKKDTSNIPISWIKKLASSSLEDVSKLEDMGIPNPKRYIEIAKKYLESMRTKEKITFPEKELLGFVKFDNNQSLKEITPVVLPKQKKALYQKQPPLDYTSFKKPTYDLEKIKKLSIKEDKSTKITKEEAKKRPALQTFFSPETMQEIRFFHFKIKKLEEALEKNEIFSFSDLNNVIEYVKLLNVNYKTQSQIRIFKELDITPSFYDPIARKEIKIWDLIFECSRVLWIAAKAYSYLSNTFEAENSMEKAIVAMVECSKMYKTAAYFSAACTRQEDKGFALSVENLELNSEESRILAQNYATLSEESKENYAMAANLSSGLSALTKRLAFLRKYDEKKENQFKAQYNYDMGRACHLKAKSLSKVSSEDRNEELVENLKKKANHYYIKAEEIWESMIDNSGKFTDPEIVSIKSNLAIVNECIIENDVEIISEKESLDIQDPEPLIIVPENLAPFIPRTTNFLTEYKQADLNFDAYRRYRNIMSDFSMNFNKIEELQNSKAGIGRTLKQLQILYDNNDIDINSFTELYEKYSIKLETIENAIRNLKNPEAKFKAKDDQKKILKSIQ